MKLFQIIDKTHNMQYFFFRKPCNIKNHLRIIAQHIIRRSMEIIYNALKHIQRRRNILNLPV